ncbi:MAG: deoxyuridine 5'-triphosphate nucleotidohydrolase [Chloroflexi bacterium]|nr:deoxyuridine 5'-triphosphate nucleotidohydrolase [Chloroflexota bacterium]
MRTGAVLDRSSLQRYLAATPPLVEGLPFPDQQLQPNGIDLTVRTVARLVGSGRLGAAPADRVLPHQEPVPFGAGWAVLPPGPYLVTLNEVLHLPTDVMALGRPRSTLLRSGVAVHNAVWDAGYHGRSQVLLVVYHPAGFAVERNARIVQLVFFTLVQPVDQGYQGAYQGRVWEEPEGLG